MTSDADDWNAPLGNDQWDTAATLTHVEPAIASADAVASDEHEPSISDEVMRLPPVPRADDVLRSLNGMPTGTPLCLEASAVTKLTMPMIQLVLAACQTAKSDGAQLTIIDPSFAFTLAFEAFGFGPDNEPYAVEFS